VVTLKAGGEVEAELRADGIPVRSLELGTHLATPGTALAMLRMARELRATGVEIVHGYQWRPSLVGAIVGRLARVPLVLASKRSLTGADTTARFGWRMIARWVDTLIANAEALREEAEAQGIVARWYVIPTGVEVEHFRVGPTSAEAKTALGLDPARPVVGTVGRLEARKGHDHFLVAARAIVAMANGRRPQMLIVGDGPLRRELTARAAELGIADQVTFTGTLDDVRGALAAMDVFVLPSRAEGLSNALLEAMAAGRPVVATDVGGTHEAFDGDRTGVLVPPGDANAMAGAVMELVSDPARAARIGRAAQGWVEARFGAAATVARLEQLYRDRLAVCTAGRAAA